MLILIFVCLRYWKSYGDCEQEERRRTFPVESPFSMCHSCCLIIRQRNSSYIWWFFLLHCAPYLDRDRIYSSFTLAVMGTKIKGIYKGFKYGLSQIFVVKEREIEIGYPTDVKHVAHIGWDGPSGNAPTWMNEFRTVPDFTTTSIGNSGSALSPWSSQEYGESVRQLSGSEMSKDVPSAELPNIKKKQKRKKSKCTSSPKSSSSNSSRTSRAAKSKSKLVGEGSTKPANIEVV
ncbi:uncharacterized protein [Primulina huaijiensis]|uniref:uncharacterized protein isoform X1 n=2 Tax=Primulina huaijiensis TaxID=1492673 RepID=UPI003CC6DD6D